MPESAEPAERWLLVGHGSVGSFLAKRLTSRGAKVFVFDPAPRVAVTSGERIPAPTPPDAPVDFAISCVPPDSADAVPALLVPAIRPDGTLFDWNTVSPATKKKISDASTVRLIDVALLDSLDANVEHPVLAVSGDAAAAAAAVLMRYGFAAAVVGDEVGQAASLKYLRSVFMKTLEALVVEYATLSAGIEGSVVVRNSLENNLGVEFGSFMDLLLATNRIHADRRHRELADAVRNFAADGARPELGAAAVQVLRQAADAWRDGAAPAADATAETLASHLRTTLWRKPAST